MALWLGFFFFLWIHHWKIENAPDCRNKLGRIESQPIEILWKWCDNNCEIDLRIGDMCCVTERERELVLLHFAAKSMTRASHCMKQFRRLSLKMKNKKKNKKIPKCTATDWLSLFHRVECYDENDTLVNRTDGQCENSSGAIKKNISTVNEWS